MQRGLPLWGDDTPPDSWRDWVAVERAVNGVPVGRPLSRRERHEVFLLWAAQGRDLTVAANEMGLSWSTAKRVLGEAA